MLKKACYAIEVPDSLKYLKAARNLYSEEFEISRKDVKLFKKLLLKNEYYITRDLSISLILIPYTIIPNKVEVIVLLLELIQSIVQTYKGSEMANVLTK